jgi:multicomponent K+:H+ antiporter subunit A
MALSSATLLLVIIALPIGGNCLAPLFPANARNAEAYLARGVALTAAILVVGLYSQVVNGVVVYCRMPWIPELGLEPPPQMHEAAARFFAD